MRTYDPTEDELIPTEALPPDVLAVLKAYSHKMQEYNVQLLTTTDPRHAHKIVELKEAYTKSINEYLGSVGNYAVVRLKEKPHE